MSDEFLRIAKQEVETELNKLEKIIACCNNDKHLFANSQRVEECLHKIKGLAPMIGQKKVGEIAKISDDILKHIMNKGVLSGSYSFVVKIVEDMQRVFHGFDAYNISNFKKLTHDRFPAVANL